jgi:predicted ATPase
MTAHAGKQFAGAVIQDPHWRESQTSAVTLQLKFQDVGPIKRGSVEVAPLSVVIGANNSGKSVLAMLTYAAMRAAETVRDEMSWRGFGSLPPGIKPREIFKERDLDTMRQFLGKARLNRQSVPMEILKNLEELQDMLCTSLGEQYFFEIERCFGDRVVDLAHRGPNGERSSPVFLVESTKSSWKIEVTFERRRPFVGRDVKFDPFNLLKQVKKAVEERYPDFEDLWTTIPPWVLLESVQEVFVEWFFSEFPRRSYYLPAARSGFLQSHKALASAVMSRAALVGIEDMQVPRFTGVIGDFIGQLIRLSSSDKGEFGNIADELESLILDGTVRVTPDATGYPEIAYGHHKMQLPLRRTSSMVSEIAPITLYLRHVLVRGDLLIIEEPESHLHPTSQLQLAQVLALLVDNGLSVFITTHSDFFLRALNNELLKSSIKNDPKSLLTVKNVRAFICRSNLKDGSTTTRRLGTSMESGISEKEFGLVAQQLYAESSKLERRVLAKSSVAKS